ncbi:MAG TPA: hypothetical protein VFN30_01640 [Chitinophagaceae bacterium]|nr:hypothetical protein [Chitinophagaceae bacterium]
MNTKTLTGALITTVLGFLLGWLIFGMLLMDFYKANMIQYSGLMKDPPEIWAIGVSNLAWGLLFAWIFNLASINSVSKGFTAGLIITFLMVLGFDLFMYASMNLYNTKALAVDVIANAVFGGLLGAVLGWWFGRGSTAKA